MRIALGIEYDGQRYYGWQRQREVPTIQAELERALAHIANEPVAVTCAGRTDAGVHATGQVVHFETPAVRPERAWTLGTNVHLPDDIAIRWAQPVAADFNARFSARARRYRYLIYNAPLRPGILHGGVTHSYYALDAGRMHRAAQCLVGEHDFSAFRASQCQSHSPWREVHWVRVSRLGHYLVVDIQANAFVHHMVRNIVGSLMVVGQGEQSEQWLAELLVSGDRRLSGATAPPDGLYLVQVSYPSEWGLPSSEPGPLFLPPEPLAGAESA